MLDLVLQIFRLLQTFSFLSALSLFYSSALLELTFLFAPFFLLPAFVLLLDLLLLIDQKLFLVLVRRLETHADLPAAFLALLLLLLHLLQLVLADVDLLILGLVILLLDDLLLRLIGLLLPLQLLDLGLSLELLLLFGVQLALDHVRVDLELRDVVQLHLLPESVEVVLVLLALQVVLQLLLVLEGLLAHAAVELLHQHLIEVPSRQRFLLFLRVLFGQLLPVLPQFLLFFLPFLGFFLLNHLPLEFLLALLLHFELLVPRVALLDVLHELHHQVVEFLPLFSAFFLVFLLDDTLHLAVGGLVGVVLVGVAELLKRCEVLPVVVEGEDLLGGGVFVAEPGRSCVLLAYLLLELLLAVELAEEVRVDSVEVFLVFLVVPLEAALVEEGPQLPGRQVVEVLLLTLLGVLALQDLLSVGIVPGALVRVRKHGVGLAHSLELVGGVFVLVLVRVPLQRCFLVGFFDVLLGGCSLKLQEFVVAGLGLRHCSLKFIIASWVK